MDGLIDMFMGRGGNFDLTRWASPVHLKLRPDYAIKLLAQKKHDQI